MPPAKMAELIKMPFGLWVRIGRKNHVLDGVPVALRDVAMTTIFLAFYIWGAHWRHLENRDVPDCKFYLSLIHI